MTAKTHSDFRPMTSNLYGQKFGHLFVTAADYTGKNGKWICLCDCGEVTTATTGYLKSGRKRSCGCKKQELINKAYRVTHGQSKAPEYRIWKDMIKRCENSSATGYENYGGRGIKVCAEWREDFAKFLAHVGPRPSPDHSIDRIDNDGNYEPGNVRWATRLEQSRNRRSVKGAKQ